MVLAVVRTDLLSLKSIITERVACFLRWLVRAFSWGGWHAFFGGWWEPSVEEGGMLSSGADQAYRLTAVTLAVWAGSLGRQSVFGTGWFCAPCPAMRVSWSCSMRRRSNLYTPTRQAVRHSGWLRAAFAPCIFPGDVWLRIAYQLCLYQIQTALALSKRSVKTGGKTVDDHSGKDLTSFGMEWYPAMVITQTSATLVFADVNNHCIFEGLWDFSFSPEFFEETC